MSGINFVQKEFLPLFLLSDLYSQYRLCYCITNDTPPPAPKLPAFLAEVKYSCYIVLQNKYFK